MRIWSTGFFFFSDHAAVFGHLKSQIGDLLFSEGREKVLGSGGEHKCGELAGEEGGETMVSMREESIFIKKEKKNPR